MKTAKIILSMMVMLAFLSLNEAMGQLTWLWSGSNIYNANTGNVGIGTSNIGLYKLLVHGGPPSAFSPQVEVWNGNPNVPGSKMLADINDNGGFNGIFNLYLNGNRTISLLASGNSFLNGGNVGIGNSTPATLLYVAKNMTEPTITVRNLGGFGGATYSMVDDASGADWKFKATAAGGFKIRDNANGLDVIAIEPNSAANSIYINSDGHVGLGTDNPSYYRLFAVTTSDGIVGLVDERIVAHFRNYSNAEGSKCEVDISAGDEGNTSLHYFAPSYIHGGGNYSSVSLLANWGKGLVLRTGPDDAARVSFEFIRVEGDVTYLDEKVRITYEGNVGIGTTTPQRKLHVNDVMRLEPCFTPPDNPAEGDIYMDGSDHVLKVYDGTEWRACW
jgi:hypothetical protein